MASSQESPLETQPPHQEWNFLMDVRREKLERIRGLGINPYPPAFSVDHSVAEILTKFEQLKEDKAIVKVAGRITARRVMGKAAFCDLFDGENRIQIYFKKENLVPIDWELFQLVDIGDILGLEGTCFTTHTGEPTIAVKAFHLLTKSLRPLPAVKEKGEKVWYKWDDPDERYRHRTIDLILNRDSRERLIKRCLITRELRSFFEEKGFLEVETPILQPLYGGAAARPFVTYHHLIDRPLYLRIADELYLKRLIAGGIHRVFEIGKDFRNEGLDRLHSPEFTMLEAYAAYQDYLWAAELMEELFPRLGERVNGSLKLDFEDLVIDLTPPYRRIVMGEAIQEACGLDILRCSREELTETAHRFGIPIANDWSKGKIIDEIFSTLVQPQLIAPTFVIDYPVELSPLAKRHRHHPELVERFELFIGGLEIVNAFSELNDPIDQRKRFEEQAQARARGDEEAHPLDEDFLTALEVGMPPTAGLGIGVDRLAMLLTSASSIREVIFFPFLKPK